jgi:hypothetical protein
MEEKLLRSLSIFKRQRSGSGNGFLAVNLQHPIIPKIREMTRVEAMTGGNTEGDAG